jgi:hypothetical protein
MDAWDGIIIGAAVSAVIGVVVTKYVGQGPQGGSAGAQPMYPANPNAGTPAPLYVIDLEPTPTAAAPVAQVNPNTEAAYNVQMVPYQDAFGPGINMPPDNEPEQALPA